MIADSVIVGLVNTGEIAASDFVRRAGTAALDASGRRTVLGAFQRRLRTEVTHPVFGYALSYRRVLEVQARLLGRWLTGEILEYPSFLTR